MCVKNPGVARSCPIPGTDNARKCLTVAAEGAGGGGWAQQELTNAVMCCVIECLPFTKKVRKFRLECKWKAYFGLPDRKISEINGTTSEVVQNSQPEFPNGKCAFHLLFLLVPGLSTCIRPGGDVCGNGTRSSHGKFPFGVLMRSICCHFRPTGFSD